MLKVGDLNSGKKIVQISSAHHVFDNRIFNKISKSLASNGYNVDLIIQHEKDEVVDGINIVALPPAKKKTDRIIKIIPILFKKVINYPAGTIFHFHDPELLPIGLLLKLFGYKVIYDIHEDSVTAIEQKKYLPAIVKKTVIYVLRMFEAIAHKKLTTIIAEKYYKERFPEAFEVLNYPKLNWATNLIVERKSPDSLLYTGSVTEDRGAYLHAKILNHMDKSELSSISIVGSCSPYLYKELIDSIKGSKSRLKGNGSGKSVPFDEIVKAYNGKEWIAGLAIFPKTRHYAQKQLTKFFEYMAAGLPIIYTDFPAWKAFLEPLNVGIAVDPGDFSKIKETVLRLKQEDDLRKKMGENGRKAILDTYNWEKEEEKLLTLYSTLASGYN
jgi:glycosyltransferase involved in cell wall biosynthesis